MKFVSWNVNGLRACVNKGFLDSFYELDADFFCLQETKLQAGQIELDLPGYEQYWCYAEKKGYSGTAVFTKHHPLSVSYGLGVAELDTEGRLITLEYPEFFLVTCYTPNAQRELARIGHRLKWEEAFRTYLKELDRKKPVILCGDLNVAHKEIDLKNPASNRGSAGFSDEERGAFTQLLDCGFTDTFRHLYPDATGAYSWWSYMFNARAKNAGWRIDYFVVSDRLTADIHEASIHPDIMGSDHCPVGLDLNITCNGGIWSPETQRPKQNDTKEADGDSPAGLFLKLGVVAGLIVALIFLVQGLLPRAPQAPGESTPTQAQTQAPVLIKQITDRTGTVTLALSTSNPFFSSYLEEKISNGTTDWIITDKTVVCTSQPPKTDGNGNPVFLFPNKHNFFVQVEYIEHDPGIPIEISVNATYTGNTTILKADYKNEHGQIGGCFLFGYISAPLELQITANRSQSIETAPPVMVYPTLFSEVIDHEGEISIEIPISSSSAYYDVIFSSETERWLMDRSHYNINLNPNYFIQVRYPDSTFFTDEDHPKVDVGIAAWPYPEYDAVNAAKALHYYDSSGRVAGFFVFGYLTTERDLTVFLRYQDTFFSMTLHAKPYFETMPTDRLARALLNSEEVRHDCAKGNIDELISNHPGIAELLRREDMIRAMLDANHYTHPGSCFDILLSCDHFQSLMTDEEKAEFNEQLQRQILYG